eukprot:3422402-Rhodomonas_salina.1
MPGSEAWRKSEAMAEQRAEHERVLLRHKAAMRAQNLYVGLIVAAASLIQVLFPSIVLRFVCFGFGFGLGLGLGWVWVWV